MDAQEQFEGFLSKYEPGVAAEAKKSLAKLRKLIPNAIEMVYDNYNALVVGFCPGMRPSEAILSIAVMPEWVSLCFLQGAKLPDPEKSYKRKCQETYLSVGSVPTLFCFGIQPNRLNVHS